MPKCEITLRHGCSPVNLLPNFRATFPRNTSEELLLSFVYKKLTTSKYNHVKEKMLLTYFRLMLHFHSPWKHKKTRTFLTSLEDAGIEKDLCLEMCQRDK